VDDESRLVARAFRQLRNEGDATSALAALDERERRFGPGTLASEAGLARAEALLLLGRTADALPILLALRDAPAGLTPEVRAVRAELLARRQALRRGDRGLRCAARARRPGRDPRAGPLRPRLLPAAGPGRRRGDRSRKLPGGVPARPLRAAGARSAGKLRRL
jgi:hypothetical protein